MLMDKVAAQNRRTLDLLAAKCYYYYCRSYEVTNQLDQVRRCCLTQLFQCVVNSFDRRCSLSVSVCTVHPVVVIIIIMMKDMYVTM